MSDFPIEAALVPDHVVRELTDLVARAAEAAPAIEEQATDPGGGLVALVRAFGELGLLRAVATTEDGGLFERVEGAALCFVRERLGHATPLADLAFAMQGLGSHPIVHSGSPELRQRWLPQVVAGRAVAAFALTEPSAGTDLAGLATTATRDGDDYVLDGHKTFISNAGVANVYSVFAVTATDAPRRRITAFAVPADAEGLTVVPQRVLGGHPIGEVHFEGVRVSAAERIGDEGAGLGVALATLSRFRPTVGAAALGFAQRALDEALGHVKRREQFGAPLAELPAVQARLADMALDVVTSRMLVYRAAAAIDADEDRAQVALRGSMAKLHATEAAQRVIDSAVQLFGGQGVLEDSIVARLYQEVRALRIYEGTNDVQKALIARHLLAGR